MKIEKLMSTGLVTVNMDDTLVTIKGIFDHFQFHHLLVLEKEVLVGVISDRDLLAALSPTVGTPAETAKDLAILNKRAHQICSRNPLTLKQKDSVVSAIEIFNKENVSCVPVVDNDNRPVGILTLRDILMYLSAIYKKS